MSGRASATACGERGHGVGHRRHDRAGLDDAQVQVGHERQRPPAGARAAVEHDRAGLGDRQRAAGEHAVEPVEVARRERRVVDHELDARDLGRARRPAPRCGAPRGGRRSRRPRRPGRRARRAGRWRGTRRRARRSARPRRRCRRRRARRRRGRRAGRPALRARGRAPRARGRGPRRAALTGSATSPGTSARGTSGSSRISVQRFSPGARPASGPAAGLREPLRALVALLRGERAADGLHRQRLGAQLATSARARRARAGGSSTLGMSILTGQTS